MTDLFRNEHLGGRRVVVLLHGGLGERNNLSGKTGLAFLRYSASPIVAAIDRTCAGGSLRDLVGIDRHVPVVASLQESLAFKPDVLLIGLAPSGGRLPEDWAGEIEAAVGAGLCIVNGLHEHLGTRPEFARLSPGQWIWDLRREPPGLRVGQARARSRSALRILTVGTDMAIGKMSTSLELYRGARDRGLKSAFVATGQAGLAIAGRGIQLDAVRVDFAAGAIEQAVLDCDSEAELIFIEGQGSLHHPGSTATLPLLRGGQPTHLILCHRAGQTHLKGLPDCPVPALQEAVQLHEAVAAANQAFTAPKVVGIALNTHHLDAEEARSAIAVAQSETGLPCTDPVRWGVENLLDAIAVRA